jgi:phosphatidylglycerol:prolipoprotein diacylglycerol transferase
VSNKSRKKPAKNRTTKAPATRPPTRTPTAAAQATDLLAPWRELGIVAPSTIEPATSTTALASTPRPAIGSADGPVALEAAGSQPPGGGCAAEVSAAGRQGVTATYWLDSGRSGPPFSVLIRFTGSRVGVTGQPQPGDRFDQVERVDGIAPGSGRVSITTRAEGVNAGRWRVTATPIQELTSARPGVRTEVLLPRREMTAHTRLAQLAHGPGVRPWLWPGLVGLGVLVGLMLQALLLARAHIDVPAATGISLGASAIGYVAAKVWYLALHRRHPRDFPHAGACIQGFLVGGIGTMVLAIVALRIPVGTFLDASTPGLFVGMAIGRPGCFFTGCCSGRPTTSRWGLWSSDRRVGTRRIPIQLIEAVAALVIGAVALPLALAGPAPIPGMIFVGAIAVYTGFRQVLFPFRVDPRTSVGRRITLAGCAVVVLADVVVSVIH